MKWRLQVDYKTTASSIIHHSSLLRVGQRYVRNLRTDLVRCSYGSNSYECLLVEPVQFNASECLCLQSACVPCPCVCLVPTTGLVTDIRMPKCVRWWHWQWVCVALDRMTSQPSVDHWPAASLHGQTDRQTDTYIQPPHTGLINSHPSSIIWLYVFIFNLASVFENLLFHMGHVAWNKRDVCM